MANPHLEQRFRELHPGRPADTVAGAWHRVFAAYMESQRHYHTLSHIGALFQAFDQVKARLKNPPVVAMAIFYHDIVYQPGMEDNESKSAEIATTELQALGWKERDIREVAAYIRSTRTHQPDTAVLEPGDLCLFLDLDLSILGADWDSYRAYVQNILREYGNNTAVKWGRKAFLEAFLRQPHIFHSQYFRNKMETRARANMDREINELLR